MLSIAKFFERIQNARSKEAFLRMAVKDAIKNVVGVEIPVQSVEFKSSTVTLKSISQSLRSAIFIKRGAILKAINEAQAIREITEIR
jgi:hypothetical protein